MEPRSMSTMRGRMDVELGSAYIPKLLSKQPKLFSPGMLQLISKSERSFTRADEHIGNSPYLESVRNTLLNMEAMAAAIIDGAEVDLMGLLMHDIKKDPNADISNVHVCSNSTTRAIQYRDFIEAHNSCSSIDDFVFCKDSLLDLHEMLNYPEGANFKRAYRGEGSCNPNELHPRLPQMRTLPPDRIEEYMEDLFKFCNTDYYTPQIQAALCHFQMEYIRPFKSRIDAMGRHMSYAIYAKRNFTENVIVAVAIESIRRIDNPLDNLKAGGEGSTKQSPLELWIYHGANMLIHQADMIMEMEKTYMETEQNWRKRVTKVRRDDICDILLRDLLAHPIINAKYVATRCGKTLPAANDALKKLVGANILAPIDNRKRNRYFYAVDILEYYGKLMDSLMPQGWLPGFELFNS